MRKVLFGAIFATMLMGCGKDYSPAPLDKEKNPMLGTFTYTFYDKTVEADHKYAANEYNEDLGTHSVTITGIKFSSDKLPFKNNVLSLGIGHYDGPGVYTRENYISAKLNRGEHLSINNSIQDVMSYVLAGSDDEVTFIEITNDDGKLKGKFDLRLIYTNPTNPQSKDTIFITDGVFDIPL